jgi:hypothetical protein
MTQLIVLLLAATRRTLQDCQYLRPNNYAQNFENNALVEQLCLRNRIRHFSLDFRCARLLDADAPEKNYTCGSLLPQSYCLKPIPYNEVSRLYTARSR